MAERIDLPSKWLNIIIGSVVVSALSNIYGNTLWRLIISNNSPITSVGWLVLGAILGGVSVLALPPIKITLKSPKTEMDPIYILINKIESTIIYISVTIGAYVIVLGSILGISRVIPILSPNLSVVGVIVLIVGLLLGIELITNFSSLRLGFFFTGLVMLVTLSYNTLQSVTSENYIGGFEPDMFFLIFFTPFFIGILVNITYGYSVWEKDDSTTS